MTTYVSYQQIKALLPDVWEAALDFIEYQFVMPGTIKTFTDQTGWQPRDVSEYKEGSAPTALGEFDDMNPSLLDRQLLTQLRPAEYGKMYLVSDRRIESDDVMDVMADAASFLGYEHGKYVEQALFGDFANLTGGKTGTGGSALTWADIYNARAILRTNGVYGPYAVVLHELQWLDLATSANIAGIATNNATPLTVRNDIQNQYYLVSLGDMDFYVTGLITIDGSTNATGAMYNSNAIALDMRRGFRIEPFRDPSLRATELNGTIVFAHGTWRPSWGIQITSDATMPGSSVSQSGNLKVYGGASASSIAHGNNVTVTFVVANVGTLTSQSIELTLTQGTNFTYVSDSETMGAYSDTTKKWTGLQLAPGQTQVLTLVFDTAANTSPNLVLAVTAETPADAGSPSATVSVTVT